MSSTHSERLMNQKSGLILCTVMTLVTSLNKNEQHGQHVQRSVQPSEQATNLVNKLFILIHVRSRRPDEGWKRLCIRTAVCFYCKPVWKFQVGACERCVYGASL